MPPASERSTLSMMSCRARRQREQPSAARTATSCARAAPRASTRPATFTQAIVRRSPTAPRSIHSRLPAGTDGVDLQRRHSRPAPNAALAVVRLDLRARSS